MGICLGILANEMDNFTDQASGNPRSSQRINTLHSTREIHLTREIADCLQICKRRLVLQDNLTRNDGDDLCKNVQSAL